MATIDVQTIVDSYLDNAGYAATGSCPEARAFETALRKLLVLPKSATHGQEEITLDPPTLRALLNDAQAWIAANCQPVTTGDAASNAGGAVHYDLADYRS